MKHVFIFVPAFGNTMKVQTTMSLFQLQATLAQKAIGTSFSSMSFPDIAELRSMVATIWHDTMPTVDYLLFIDSDMAFTPEIVLDMLHLDEPIVGAIYRQRKEPISWAGSGSGEPITERRGNFMKVEGVGMGVTLIRKDAMRAIIEKFPETIDTRLALHPANGLLTGAGCNRLLRVFEKMEIKERGIISEDLSFCIRWGQCGGSVWGAINYQIHHIGDYDYSGNYLEHVTGLQQQMAAQQDAMRRSMELQKMQQQLAVKVETPSPAIVEDVTYSEVVAAE